MRSQLYKEKGLYEDLKWLADNYLHVGMDREDVEIILGSDNEPNVGNPKYEALYSSMREVPRGDYLSITLKDNKVETWGWIDE